jgi:hypothetical protein
MERKIQKRFNQVFQHKKDLNKTYFLKIKQKLTLSSLGETLPHRRDCSFINRKGQNYVFKGLTSADNQLICDLSAIVTCS